MKSSLLLVGLIVLALFLWLQSQGKMRGLQTRRLVPRPGTRPSCGLANALKNLFSSQQKQSGGKTSGGGGSSGGGSGGGTAGGQRSCNKTPGFCGCLSNYAFAGVDANGNEIYQRSDGSLVYSDGSEATQADIVDATGACVGTVCNPTVPDPQCVQTAQPCSFAGVSGSCCPTSGGCCPSQCWCGGGGGGCSAVACTF